MERPQKSLGIAGMLRSPPHCFLVVSGTIASFLVILFFALSVDMVGFYTSTTLVIPMWWCIWIWMSSAMYASSAFRSRVHVGLMITAILMTFIALVCYFFVGEIGGGLTCIWSGAVCGVIIYLKKQQPEKKKHSIENSSSVPNSPTDAATIQQPQRTGCAKCRTRCGCCWFIVIFICIFLAMLDSIQRAAYQGEIQVEGEFVQSSIFGVDILLECKGEGSPVVVFESGLGTFRKLSFRNQYYDVAQHTRACWYDRPGYGRSPNAAKHTQVTYSALSDSLWEILQKHGEQGPFLLVGHSMGGPTVRTFTINHPSAVAGLFLIDTSSEDAPLVEGLGPAFQIMHLVAPLSIDLWFLSAILGSFGLTGLITEDYACYGNDRIFKAIWQELYSANLIGYQEMRELRDTMPSFGKLPVVMLTSGDSVQDYGGDVTQIPDISANGTVTAAGTILFYNVTNIYPVTQDSKPMTGWLDLQRAQLTVSSDNQWEIFPNNGHYIASEQPVVVLNRLLAFIQKLRTQP